MKPEKIYSWDGHSDQPHVTRDKRGQTRTLSSRLAGFAENATNLSRATGNWHKDAIYSLAPDWSKNKYDWPVR